MSELSPWLIFDRLPDPDDLILVITSYSIHYTKLYDIHLSKIMPGNGQKGLRPITKPDQAIIGAFSIGLAKDLQAM